MTRAELKANVDTIVVVIMARGVPFGLCPGIGCARLLYSDWRNARYLGQLIVDGKTHFAFPIARITS